MSAIPPLNVNTTAQAAPEDFESEVLKMPESGQSVPVVSQALGIGENLIYRWKVSKRLS